MDPIMIIVCVVLFAAFIALQYFTRKKNKKAGDSFQDMLNSLEKGDKVYLISRLVATVVRVEEGPGGDKFVIVETGDEGRKSTLTFDIKAIYSVLSKANAKSTAVEEKVDAPAETVEEKTEEVVSEN